MGPVFFQIESNRYERSWLMAASIKLFGRWCEVLGDDAILVKGDSYRLNNRDIGRPPAANTDQ